MKFPERRQSLRVVTLKNAAWVAVALFAFFLVYSTYNELRSVDPSRERLYERGRDTVTTTAAPPAEVVGEAPAPSATYDLPPLADVELHTQAPLEAAPPAPDRVPPQTARPATLEQTRKRGGKTVVTGGPEGLSVQVQPSTTTATSTNPR